MNLIAKNKEYMESLNSAELPEFTNPMLDKIYMEVRHNRKVMDALINLLLTVEQKEELSKSVNSDKG